MRIGVSETYRIRHTYPYLCFIALEFHEEFDFEAMNEKFRKDEVWGSLGRGTEKVEENDHYCLIPNPKPAYNKDEFFDSISGNSLTGGLRNGQNRFSERMKQDTETFDNFQQRPTNFGYGGNHGGNFRGANSSGRRGYGYYGGRSNKTSSLFSSLLTYKMSNRMEEIKDMLAKMNDGESVSSVPIKLNHLNVIVSILAPEYYTEQQLSQLKSFSEQEIGQTSLVAEPTSKKRSCCSETEQMCGEKTMKEKNKKSKKMPLPIVAKTPPSELPGTFMDRITELNGSDIKFLMHKKLCLSDLLKNNNRLSMPKSQIGFEFLTEDEKEKLNERKEDPRARLIGTEITLIDPCLREYKITLKKWEMKGVIYNLVTNWHKVVEDNNFKMNQELDIWSFRVDGKLYFVLNNCECR
ncbi:hypothetical protein Lal_00012131 [Lupinus albus]|nr:hypothetical protein Lal_00012131 [Lupinus albus]